MSDKNQFTESDLRNAYEKGYEDGYKDGLDDKRFQRLLKRIKEEKENKND